MDFSGIRFFCVNDHGVSVRNQTGDEVNPFEGTGAYVCGQFSEGLVTLNEVMGEDAKMLSQVLDAGVLRGIMTAYGAYYHTPPCIRTGVRTYRPRIWEEYLFGVAG